MKLALLGYGHLKIINEPCIDTNLDEREERLTANIVFIKLWLDVKYSTINRYFAFAVN